MRISDYLSPDAILPDVQANCKKRSFQVIAQRASEITKLPEAKIVKALNGRERLGTTGVGQGVALPHAKLDELDSVIAVFARLRTPVDFESTDHQAVDLIVALLAPDNAGAEHLKALAQFARIFHDGKMAQKLRDTNSAAVIYSLLENYGESTAIKPTTVHLKLG